VRDVIGQRRLLARLGEQALEGDVAHAYELSGPRSIGKRTVAIRLAQTLLCTSEPRIAGGCGICLACRKVEHFTHPDVRLVTRLVDLERDADKKLIAIEQIREMQQDLALRPLEGSWRVVIIDDAADLSEHAEVALLKTLEEPPPHAVLLLLTPTPARLLETIRSRLVPLPMRLVATTDIADGLDLRFGHDARRHAAAGAGRPGVAIALAMDEAVRKTRRTLESEFYKLVGSGLTDRFAWAVDLAESERDTQKRNEAIQLRLIGWSELARDAAVAAYGIADRALRPDRERESVSLAKAVSQRELVDLALSLDRWRRDVIESNVNARMLLELLALRLPYAAAFAGAAT
jgi:DNA polymerase III subunit delta'